MKRRNSSNLNCVSKMKHQHANLPKLRPIAIDQFLKYSKLKYSYEEAFSKKFPLRHALINGKFHQKVKETGDLVLELSVVMEENPPNQPNDNTPFNFLKIKQNKEKKDLDALLNFIKFVGYSTLEFYFFSSISYYQNGFYAINFGGENGKLDKKLIQNLAYLCQGIKDIPSVQKIHVNFTDTTTTLKNSISSLFIDLLPQNKKISIKSSCDVSSIVKGRKEPLELVEINGMDFSECTSQIFRTNTEELRFTTDKFSYNSIVKLHYLEKIGPFSPNKFLQKLKIHINLINTDKNEIEKKKITTEKWNNEFSMWHKKSFEYLRGINENLKLELFNKEKVMVGTPEEAIEFYENQLERTKSIINMSQKFGPKVEIFEIKTRIDFQSLPCVNVKEASDFFISKTNLKVLIKNQGGEKKNTDNFVNLIEYEGTKIMFNIKFFQSRQQIALLAGPPPLIDLTGDTDEEN